MTNEEVIDVEENSRVIVKTEGDESQFDRYHNNCIERNKEHTYIIVKTELNEECPVVPCKLSEAKDRIHKMVKECLEMCAIKGGVDGLAKENPTAAVRSENGITEGSNGNLINCASQRTSQGPTVSHHFSESDGVPDEPSLAVESGSPNSTPGGGSELIAKVQSLLNRAKLTGADQEMSMNLTADGGSELTAKVQNLAKAKLIGDDQNNSLNSTEDGESELTARMQQNLTKTKLSGTDEESSPNSTEDGESELTARVQSLLNKAKLTGAGQENSPNLTADGEFELTASVQNLNKAKLAGADQENSLNLTEDGGSELTAKVPNLTKAKLIGDDQNNSLNSTEDGESELTAKVQNLTKTKQLSGTDEESSPNSTEDGESELTARVQSFLNKAKLTGAGQENSPNLTADGEFELTASVQNLNKAKLTGADQENSLNLTEDGESELTARVQSLLNKAKLTGTDQEMDESEEGLNEQGPAYPKKPFVTVGVDEELRRTIDKPAEGLPPSRFGYQREQIVGEDHDGGDHDHDDRERQSVNHRTTQSDLQEDPSISKCSLDQEPNEIEHGDDHPRGDNSLHVDNYPREDNLPREDNSPREDNPPREDNSPREDNPPREDNQEGRTGEELDEKLHDSNTSPADFEHDGDACSGRILEDCAEYPGDSGASVGTPVELSTGRKSSRINDKTYENDEGAVLDGGIPEEKSMEEESGIPFAGFAENSGRGKVDCGSVSPFEEEFHLESTFAVDDTASTSCSASSVCPDRDDASCRSFTSEDLDKGYSSNSTEALNGREMDDQSSSDQSVGEPSLRITFLSRTDPQTGETNWNVTNRCSEKRANDVEVRGLGERGFCLKCL